MAKPPLEVAVRHVGDSKTLEHDLATIASMSLKLFSSNYDKKGIAPEDYALEIVRANQTHPLFDYFVAENEEMGIVGYGLTLKPAAAQGVAYLWEHGVPEEYQRRGIGKRLIVDVFDWWDVNHEELYGKPFREMVVFTDYFASIVPFRLGLHGGQIMTGLFDDGKATETVWRMDRKIRDELKSAK